MYSEILLASKRTLNYKQNLGFRFIKRLILTVTFVGALVLLAYLDFIPEQTEEIRPTDPTIEVSPIAECSTVSPSLKNKTIYFVDTKRPSDYTLNLGPRQGCAIESAAKNNPDFNVTLFTLNVTDLAENSSITKALREYSNIKIIPTTLEELTNDTIAESWVTEGEIYKSKHVVVHFSDFLRFFLLYKFGGIYLDTDMIVLKSLGDLKPGWAVAETDYWVGSAALSFDSEGFGHYVAEFLVREFMKTFNGTEYAWNGPNLLTRVAHKLCFTEETKLMKRDRCYDYEILETKLFFPVGYDAKEPLFNPEKLNETMELVKDSYAVHCWNGLIGGDHLKKGTKAAIGVWAETHCPKVYATVTDVFR